MKSDSFLGGTQPYESNYFSFIYVTQCVSSAGFKLTIPISLEKSPSLR